MVSGVELCLWVCRDERAADCGEVFGGVWSQLDLCVLGDVSRYIELWDMMAEQSQVWRPEERGRSLRMYSLIQLLGAAVGMSSIPPYSTH